jgi:hypothetical protein
MKLSEAPSKIVGIQVGELALNLIRTGVPMLQVKFSLLTEEHGSTAFMDVSDAVSIWSSKVLDAMKAFTDAIEEDALKILFKVDAQQTTETSTGETSDEPVQF